jgi:hypothetical protein
MSEIRKAGEAKTVQALLSEGHHPMPDQWKREAFFLLLLLILSILFVELYFVLTIEWRYATFYSLVDFSALKPFQCRILVPALIRVLHQIFKVDIQILFKGITVLSVFFLLLAFRRLLQKFFSRKVSEYGTFLLLYPLVWNYCIYGRFRVPYDLPAVLLFTVGLIAILEKRLVLFYLVLLVGALNRETIVFLIGAFALLQDRPIHWKRLIPHIAAQSCLVGGVLLMLDYLFRAQSGAMHLQVRNNIAILLTPYLWPRVLLTFGGSWLLILAFWRIQHPVIKRLLVLIIPFTLSVFLVGIITELRIYSELVAIITVALLSSVLALWDKVVKWLSSSGVERAA